MGDVIFSLDIGTRNVVGIIGKMVGDTYKIIDSEIVSHPDRAMYDGQIHDIEKVAEVVKIVKDRLEERNGEELKYVSIAAAGRALKTNKVSVERDIDSNKEISTALIDSLEIEAIQKAQSELENNLNRSKEPRYYCVGYTVVNYYLDGSIIGNLKGHKGNKIGAEVLATFLPHVVVDSLYTAVDMVGLEVINLTLEPIAAINIAIPPKFRLLNLALVDVGAGTSDIAITKNGSIVSYAMVSVAGDEITESISQAFLLDFNTAESLKVELNKTNIHKYSDIIGIEHEVSTEEVMDKIDNVIKDISNKIGEKIIEYNGQAPSAVFCIGGGSQIPGLTKHLAEFLGLPQERVAVRGTNMLESIDLGNNELDGPEFVTPIGIGYTAIKDREQDFFEVTLNEKVIKLFNSKELSVSDALILIGYNPRKLIAKKGKPLSFILNGKKRTYYGDYGETAKIYVNGNLSSLDTRIKNKDNILIEPATEGKDAQLCINDIISNNEKVIFNKKEINLIKIIKANGIPVDMSYQIKENDDIKIERINNIEELLKLHDLSHEKYDVVLNGISSNIKARLKPGDVIEINIKQEPSNETSDKNNISEDEYIFLKVNNKDIKIKKEKRDMIFVDIFDHIDFDRTKAKGILELRLNGHRANYTDILNDNDIIEVYWK